MSHTLGEIAKLTGASLAGNPECEIHGVGTLEKAGTGEISFFSNRRYINQLKKTRASAVILKSEDLSLCPVDTLVTGDPYLAFAITSSLLNPEAGFKPGIHPSSSIDNTAIIHPTAYVGPNAVIAPEVKIAESVYIGPGCSIGKNASIGANSRLYANVVLYDGVNIGARAILHSGVVIGADGFGIANDRGKWVKIPQTGSVIIGNDVEIGANTTVDRGTLENTIIEDGVKIDNQVQVGHNVHICENTAIAGCVAIAGSTRIGKRCMIGGACGISGHIEICDDVILMGMTGVANSIRKPGMYASGIPAMDVKSWRKNVVLFKQLYILNNRIRKITSDK